MRTLAGLAVTLLGFVFIATTIAAEPKQPEKVARLIRDLGAGEFDARNQADQQLGRMGPEVRRELETAANSDDAEVRFRAQRLLERIKVAELWEPLVVQPVPAGVRVSQTFEALARQSGNHLTVGERHAPAAEAMVAFSLPAASFWETVDELCQRTGNHVRPNYDSQAPGFVVTAGPPGKFPTAYSGPLRVQITSARRVFNEDLDYENRKSDVTHTFQFNLQMMWEDRMRLVAYTAQPDLVEAAPDHGKPLAAVQTSGSSWNVATASTRQVSASLRIVPPPASATTFQVLRLKWGLVAVGDMTTAEISPVEVKARRQQGDFLAVIESVEQPSAARCEMCLTVARELDLPEPQEILLEENLVTLLDQQGHKYRLLSQTNSINDRGVQMKLSFASDSVESVPQKLQVTYPRLRSRREAEIVFRDVPLPVSRPQ